ncbi:MAG: hypothetical protein PVJ74_12085 [Gammaproteobacteria bacterium]|jgi:hypothetical protein
MRSRHDICGEILISTIVMLFASSPALAEIETKTVTYGDGDVTLEGFLAWDDAQSARRPGVLVA